MTGSILPFLGSMSGLNDIRAFPRPDTTRTCPLVGSKIIPSASGIAANEPRIAGGLQIEDHDSDVTTPVADKPAPRRRSQCYAVRVLLAGMSATGLPDSVSMTIVWVVRGTYNRCASGSTVR